MRIALGIISAIYMCLASCTKKIPIVNLNGDKIGCFGHAGMGNRSVYPANTMESFQTCLYKGADGTEMDVQVTKDSVLVIFHDDDLSGATACGGIIRNMDWDEINSCRVNSPLFKHLSVISFDEFMSNISNPYSYTYTFDCKRTPGDGDENDYYRRFVNTLVKTIEAYGIQENVLIENSDPFFLNRIKTANNNLKVFLLADNYESGIQTAVQNNFYGLSMDNSKVSKDQVSDAHARNIRMTVYGVNSNKQNYDAVEKQPDFIQTDDLDYLLRIFGKLDRRKGILYSIIKDLE